MQSFQKEMLKCMYVIWTWGIRCKLMWSCSSSYFRFSSERVDVKSSKYINNRGLIISCCSALPRCGHSDFLRLRFLSPTAFAIFSIFSCQNTRITLTLQKKLALKTKEYFFWHVRHGFELEHSSKSVK